MFTALTLYKFSSKLQEMAAVGAGLQDMQKVNKYMCYNCAKPFPDKTNLERHKNRKTPCIIRDVDPADVANPNRCIYCNKLFCKPSNLNRHHATCKVRNGGMQILAGKTAHEQMVEEQLAAMQATIDAQQAAMQAQAEKIKQLEQRPAGTTNNTTINNNNNNVNIVFNCWETPDLRQLIAKDAAGVSKIVSIIRRELVGAPLALIREVWFNPDNPANHAIYLANKLTGEVLTWDGKRWRMDNIKKVGTRMRDRAYGWTDHVGKLVDRPDLLQQLAANRADVGLGALEVANIRAIVCEGRDVVRAGRGTVPRI
jgi:hypothetical protein